VPDEATPAPESSRSFRQRWAELSFETKVTKIWLPVIVVVLTAMLGVLTYLAKQEFTRGPSKPSGVAFIVQPSGKTAAPRLDLRRIKGERYGDLPTIQALMQGLAAPLFASPTGSEPLRMLDLIDSNENVLIDCEFEGTAHFHFGMISQDDFFNGGRWVLMRDLAPKGAARPLHLKLCKGS
jgi:hypothetical protein